MRRRSTGQVERSPFAAWLDALWCKDPEWLAAFGELRYSGDADRVAAAWQAWPGHRQYALWWIK